MNKSDINQPACYFDRYIKHAADTEILQALKDSITELETLDLVEFNQIGDAVYAEGKWTLKDIFQHLIDTEHILAYRSLRIGRNDKTKLPGFEESLLAANVSTKDRILVSIIDELKLRRQVTTLLFESFSDEALQRFIVANGVQMSALAYGFTIVGHQKHHLRIINERYVPLK